MAIWVQFHESLLITVLLKELTWCVCFSVCHFEALFGMRCAVLTWTGLPSLSWVSVLCVMWVSSVKPIWTNAPVGEGSGKKTFPYWGDPVLTTARKIGMRPVLGPFCMCALLLEASVTGTRVLGFHVSALALPLTSFVDISVPFVPQCPLLQGDEPVAVWCCWEGWMGWSIWSLSRCLVHEKAPAPLPEMRTAAPRCLGSLCVLPQMRLCWASIQLPASCIEWETLDLPWPNMPHSLLPLHPPWIHRIHRHAFCPSKKKKNVSRD